MKRKENNAPTLREVISKTFKIIKEYKKRGLRQNAEALILFLCCFISPFHTALICQAVFAGFRSDLQIRRPQFLKLSAA